VPRVKDDLELIQHHITRFDLVGPERIQLSIGQQNEPIMQTLWSRAARTKSCRCTSNLSTATAVARRSTTAASRRRLNLGDVFTVFSSATFATAAVADAKIKANRREKWDKAIEEVRDGLKTRIEDVEPPTQREADEQARNSHNELSTYATEDSWRRTLGLLSTDRTSNTELWSAIHSLSPAKGQESLLEAQLRILEAQLHQANNVEESNESGELRESNGSDREPLNGTFRTSIGQPCREPKTQDHLNKLQDMTLNLVAELRSVKTASQPTESSEPGPHSASIRDRCKAMTERLSEVQHWFSKYSTYAPVSMYLEERLAMNRSIHSILSSKEDGPIIDLMVAKICYNLLISQSPPNITTFNLLILHFTRLEQHSLAAVVVNTLFKRSRFKPDESTIVALLQHYIACNDQKGFESLIRRMRAVDGDMRIARRSIWQLSQPEIQQWARSSKVVRRNDYLYEKVPRTQAIFDSLVVGNFKFYGFRRALRYARAAVREGYSLTQWIFEELAAFCVVRCSVRASISLLQVFLTQFGSTVKPSVPRLDNTTKYWASKVLSVAKSTQTKMLDRKLHAAGLQPLYQSLQIRLRRRLTPTALVRLSLQTSVQKSRQYELVISQFQLKAIEIITSRLPEHLQALYFEATEQLSNKSLPTQHLLILRDILIANSSPQTQRLEALIAVCMSSAIKDVASLPAATRKVEVNVNTAINEGKALAEEAQILSEISAPLSAENGKDKERSARLEEIQKPVGPRSDLPNIRSRIGSIPIPITTMVYDSQENERSSLRSAFA
jgi:hypothetical protein